jgi:hypothetical protein
VANADVAEPLGCQNGARPRSKVLRGDLSSGDLAEVLVDVAGVHALPTAIVVEVLE